MPVLSSLNRIRPRGFTLFEVMISVAIIGLIVTTIFRFVQANLQAIQQSTQLSEQRESVVGLISFIQDQLNNLPADPPNVLVGEPFKKNNLRGDRMEWTCRAGEGVLTTSAPDEYRVVLTLETVNKDDMAIGIRRRLVDEDIKNSKFLPLLRGVTAFKVKYFDKRSNGYSDNWRDPGVKPWGVQVSIWRKGEEEPYVAVLPVPGSNTQ